MKVKVYASFTGVVATGEFENQRPMFGAEIEFEMLEPLTEEDIDQAISEAQQDLHQIAYNNFKDAERKSVVARIEKEKKNIRFYEYNGEQYPSVTSIIGWDLDFYVTAVELSQYASQSTINHLKLQYFIEKNEWFEAKKIPEAHKHIVILQKGHLKLEIDSGNLPAFITKYPITFTGSEITVYNKDHKYAGTLDAPGQPIINKDWEKAGAIDAPTIFDIKRTPNVKKDFKQLAAYAKAYSPDIKQLCIIPINNKTDQGYSKPIITQDIDAYFKMFLQDRQSFKDRFAI